MFGKISPNSSNPEDVCEYLRDVQNWRQVYLTEQVHINLGLTFAVTVITCPLNVWFNGMILFTVFSNPLMRKIPSNLSVALMTITDFLIGAVTQPLLIVSWSCRITGHCNSCTVDSALCFVTIWLIVASAFHLALVATDRLIAIKCPYRYQDLVTVTRLSVGAVLAWVLGFLITICGVFRYGKNTIIGVSIIVSLLVLIAGVFTISCYIVIYLESRRHQKAIENQVPQNLKQTLRKEFKASKTTFLMTCAVGVTYVINCAVVSAVKYLYPYKDSLSNASVYFSATAWALTLFQLNSFFNAIIYYRRSERIGVTFSVDVQPRSVPRYSSRKCNQLCLGKVKRSQDAHPNPRGPQETNADPSLGAWVIPMKKETNSSNIQLKKSSVTRTCRNLGSLPV